MTNPNDFDQPDLATSPSVFIPRPFAHPGVGEDLFTAANVSSFLPPPSLSLSLPYLSESEEILL